MIIKVKVKPASNKQEIIFDKTRDTYIIKLKSKPERNKANFELINLLASFFQVSRESIKIISGIRNTTKLIKIDEIS